MPPNWTGNAESRPLKPIDKTSKPYYYADDHTSGRILEGKGVRLVVFRRVLYILLPAVLLASLCGASLAQIAPVPLPEAGVRGSGAIPLRTNATLGAFDINVAKSGDVLLGGFRYQEVGLASSIRGNVILSKTITSLTVSGNTATILADGYWNNMPATIKIEVLDDNPSGDWFHITAVPKGPLTIIYDQAGGVIKGDIVVYGGASNSFANGYGTIAVSNTNIGKFKFEATSVGGIVRGSLNYAEYSPIASTAFTRPPISIFLPAVQYLRVEGNTAVFGGVGKLNGRLAKIEVRAIDNSMLMGPIARPDEFYIKAQTDATTEIADISYEAGGPVKGEITVGTRNIL